MPGGGWGGGLANSLRVPLAGLPSRRTVLLKKLLLGLVGLVFAVAAGAWAWLALWLPRDIPVSSVTVRVTPERVAWGGYLANQVIGCTYCHSGRDWTLFSAPVVPGQLGAGGQVFDESVGFPGRLVAINLTPAGIGDWTDGELLRAITGGLSRDGHALFPVMPYDAYRLLRTDDAEAIVAYLRSLAPVPASAAGERRLGFPLNLIANTIPAPATPRDVDPADAAAWGEYLATLAGCGFCHTPVDERQRALPGMQFGGGRPWPVDGVDVRSSNISPDRDTGIGAWTPEQFIARFRRYQGEAGRIPVSEVGYNTQMPWTLYADMTDADLAAIFAYLMAQPPVRNAVTVVDGR